MTEPETIYERLIRECDNLQKQRRIFTIVYISSALCLAALALHNLGIL